jgi:hypothetical protein
MSVCNLAVNSALPYPPSSLLFDPLLPPTPSAARLTVTLVNTAEEENTLYLNDKCGAEYVQKGQQPPKGMDGRGGKRRGAWGGQRFRG